MEIEHDKGHGVGREDGELEAVLREALELLDRRDELLDQLKSSPELPEEGLFRERFAALLEAQRLHDLAGEKLYPPNPPNRSCGHATVGGILFFNTVGLKRGDYERLFEFGHETAYVWTHTRHEYSALVAEVDGRVREEGVWKTLGCCLRIAMAFHSDFEHARPAEEFSYCWVYYFDPKTADA